LLLYEQLNRLPVFIPAKVGEQYFIITSSDVDFQNHIKKNNFLE
jgi:hypothetical protein